ncbi:hypothetical protein, partial [Listeria monocytogenes]
KEDNFVEEVMSQVKK